MEIHVLVGFEKEFVLHHMLSDLLIVLLKLKRILRFFFTYGGIRLLFSRMRFVPSRRRGAYLGFRAVIEIV